MLGQDLESAKLDITQTIMESCALDEEGYCIQKGGRNMAVSRHKNNLDGRYKTERDGVQDKESLKKAV